MQIRYLTFEELLEIHKSILDETGGEKGLLSIENLESSVFNPRQHIFGKELFATVSEKAASLFHDIAKLHPFVDGNKRTAYQATDTFLVLNEELLICEPDEASEFAVEVAQCTKNLPDIETWIYTHQYNKKK